MSSLDVRSIDDKQLRKQPSPAVKHEFRVFLSEAAFDRAVARGDGDVTREIGGVLVGELLRDDAGPYLRIDATIDALHAEEKGAELTFTHATWEHIHKEMDGKHQDKKVVGWYHTHPGFGVFLSDRDQFIHKSFFNLPFQVAFVYDPKTHDHGMFTWHDNEVWRARRYWIGPREQVWDGPRVPADQGRDKAEPEKARPEADRGDGGGRRAADDGPQGATLGMFVAVGIVLLLLGGFVGRWWGLGSANEALTQMQVEVLKARADGAQLAQQSLQSGLVDLLRDTFSDEALRRPVIQAVGILDQMIAALPPDTAVAAPGMAPAAGGSGAPASGAAGPGPGNADPRWATFAIQLKTARETLAQVQVSRDSLQRDLANLAATVHQGNGLPAEVARDLVEQHAVLGGLYAELATDAAKAGDKARARRLLATAAHLDPGNRTRYDKQLQSFDPSGRLSPEPPDRTGSAAQGAPR